jgi:hypothetical protein
MKLKPYRNILLRTSLTPEEIIQRLKINIFPEGGIKGKSSKKKFTGRIHKNEFEIERILVNYYSSFNPVIYGKVKEDSGGALIEMEIDSGYAKVFGYLLFSLS